MSIKGLVDKQNVVYTYKATLFSLNRKEILQYATNTDEPWRHNAKWKSVTLQMILFIWGA